MYGFTNNFVLFLFMQCQSHQIFHMFVLAAAFVHFHGVSQIAANRLTLGDCVYSQPQTY